MKKIENLNRIIIGDVGSGKTIVAFCIALSYLRGLDNGQVAMLAPTEVLAYQHYQKLMSAKTSQKQKDLLEFVDIIFVSGKQYEINGIRYTTAKFKKELEKENFYTKKHVFWIGTHALLYNDLIKPDMVLVDEQHRFGVKQRQKLSENQENELVPHFLSFTATPIPRTLALSMYQDLKPHFLERLTSRNPIQTTINTFDKLETEIIEKIQYQIDQNYKVYIICPAVEDLEEDEKEEKKRLWSVEKIVKIMNKYFPKETSYVHGKLKDKKKILSDFKENPDNKILVSTTVVEVGVDVSEATMVVILNAERFGLSALHQIRGRVGRNNYPDNYCILVTEKEFVWSKRLKFLCQYQDGFALAEKDLELRGSGDMIGSAQSGFDDDIQGIIGLNPQLYKDICDVANEVDFDNLKKELPRLDNYINMKKAQIWEE